MLAKRESRRYTGSTSSLTGMLSHIYFLISGFRDVNTSSLSQHFQNEVSYFYSVIFSTVN
jgi:Mitochondrial protein Pet127